MNIFSFNPANVNLRRISILITDLGGAARLVQNTKADGTLGAVMLLVNVPYTVTIDTVTAAITEATGVTDLQQDTWEATRNKTIASNLIDDVTVEARSLRILASILINEINTLRSWIRDFKTATDNATTLATFKTNVAGLPTLTDRTLVQAKNAYKTAIDAEA